MSNDVIGTRIGIYDILYECNFKSNDGHKLYHVKCCECGYETNMQLRHIGDAKKCTHINKNGTIKMFSAYTWENKRIGGIFQGMIQRCYNEHDKSYRWYGAKGIQVYDEWINNPKSFEYWALENGYADDLTIDRIKEDDNYCPENCRWVTGSNNAKYKSTTKMTTVDGISHTGREWADILHVGTNVINTMLRRFPEEQVKKFIKKRKLDPSKHPTSHQTWFQVYEIS